MSIFSDLTGSSFGKLRDDMQQGFRGGSFSEGGKAAIKAFDPLISKERFANVLNKSVGGGELFGDNTMNDQADLANTVGKLYAANWAGGEMGDMFGGGEGAEAGSNPSWMKWAKMGGQMGGGMGGGMGGSGGSSGGTTQSDIQREQTQAFMDQQKEKEKAMMLAAMLQNYNVG